MNSKLITIAKKNKHDDYKKHLNNLFYFFQSKRNALLDATLSAFALSAIIEKQDFTAFTPEMKEAFNVQFPQIEFENLQEHLSGMSEEALSGFINAWKGKVFEVETVNALNSGEMVGNIQLEPGQTAQLAENLNNSGWDLEIISSSGQIIDVIQNKATESLSYLHEAVSNYPTIEVLATSEVASQSLSPLVIDSGFSNEELTHNLTNAIGDMMDSNPIFEVLLDAVPFLPFAIIGVQERAAYLKSTKSKDSAIEATKDRALKTGASMGVGWGVVTLLDGGLLSIPASMGTRVLLDRKSTFEDTTKQLKLVESQIKGLLPYPNYSLIHLTHT